MTEPRRRAPLGELPMKEFLDRQRAIGRAALPREDLDRWAGEHERAVGLLKDPATGRRDRALAAFLKEITFPLAALRESPVPTYYPYTCAHMLDWYLGESHQPLDHLKARAAEGIFYLLLDLIRFESQSLTGVEGNHREHFDREITLERLKVLERAVDACHELGRQVPGATLDPDRGPRRYDTLAEYAEEPSRRSAMIELSCLPQTCFHDEVIFLRTIHIAEFCFYGIRVAAQEARELLRLGLPHAAAAPLEQATAFGALLYQAFKVLRTMPPQHFLDFRDATGDASAIQSLNYQLMEIHLRGVNSGKAEHLRRIPHLRQLAKFAHPGFIHLQSLLREADPEAPGWGEVLAAARSLDQKWLTWRGLHLSFAIVYLPQAVKGTGDTAGAPYLRKFLRAGLFDTTEIDLPLVEELFGNHPEIPNLFRARPGVGIAPAEELRAYREPVMEP